MQKTTIPEQLKKYFFQTLTLCMIAIDPMPKFFKICSYMPMNTDFFSITIPSWTKISKLILVTDNIFPDTTASTDLSDGRTRGSSDSRRLFSVAVTLARFSRGSFTALQKSFACFYNFGAMWSFETEHNSWYRSSFEWYSSKYRGRGHIIRWVQSTELGDYSWSSQTNHRCSRSSHRFCIFSGRNGWKRSESRIPRRCTDWAQGVRERRKRSQRYQNEANQRGPTAVQSVMSAAHLMHYRLTTTMHHRYVLRFDFQFAKMENDQVWEVDCIFETNSLLRKYN